MWLDELLRSHETGLETPTPIDSVPPVSPGKIVGIRPEPAPALGVPPVSPVTPQINGDEGAQAGKDEKPKSATYSAGDTQGTQGTASIGAASSRIPIKNDGDTGDTDFPRWRARSAAAAAAAAVAAVAAVADVAAVAAVGAVAAAAPDAAEKCAVWLVRFADAEPLESHYWPPMTHAEVLAEHPLALAAEPLRRPSSARQADAAEHAAVPPAAPAPAQPAFDAPGCSTCHHLRKPGKASGYCASGREDLEPAYGLNHPLRRLPDDGGHGCQHFTLAKWARAEIASSRAPEPAGTPSFNANCKENRQ